MPSNKTVYPMITVTCLSNPDKQLCYMLPPKQAVIAAYAQNLNDFSTWDYERKYDDLVVIGDKTIACGDYCTMKGETDDTLHVW